MFPLHDAVIGVSLSESLNSVANMKQIQPLSHGQLCKLLWELGGDCVPVAALGTTPGLFAFDLSWGKFKRKEEHRVASRQAKMGLSVCNSRIGWTSCSYT